MRVQKKKESKSRSLPAKNLSCCLIFCTTQHSWGDSTFPRNSRRPSPILFPPLFCPQQKGRAWDGKWGKSEDEVASNPSPPGVRPPHSPASAPCFFRCNCCCCFCASEVAAAHAGS